MVGSASTISSVHASCTSLLLHSTAPGKQPLSVSPCKQLASDALQAALSMTPSKLLPL